MSYDIHFQMVPTADQDGSGKVFTFGFVSAVGVRGPQKLFNRWVKCLLTTKGTDPLNKQYGTIFSSLIGSNITSDSDVMDATVIAIEDCNDQIHALDLTNFPPDNEKLQSASLYRIVPLNEDGYDIYIQIKNVAGQVLTMQLPAVATRI